MHEFEFIDWLRRLLDRPGDRQQIPVGIGDDMAVVNFHGGKLLIGSDMTIEGVHFDLANVKMEQIAHKALGRCLSDCAAMAGVPVGAVISVAKPDSLSEEMLKDLYRGFSKFACPIIGGDTSHSPDRLVIDVCLLGECVGNEPVLRSGAEPGDYLYVTGALGGSILGKHLNFEPRIEQALWIARNLPLHAMIDISDGLSSDLNHLCRESKCGAEIFLQNLETIISDDAKKLAGTTNKNSIDHALNDGEDFELLAAIALSPENLPPLPLNVGLFPIGKIISEKNIYIVEQNCTRKKLIPGGYSHF